MQKYLLITYEISKLEQKVKMQLIRKLNGYDSIKQGKVERKQGILDEMKGFRFGTNTIIVQYNKKEDIERFFKQYKVGIKSLIINF
jgi:hypothetical protein